MLQPNEEIRIAYLFPGLWVLADKLLIPCLQNYAIDAIEEYRKTTGNIATYAIPYIYENTSKNSPLRRFFVETCTWYLRGTCYKEWPNDFPKEMLLDLSAMFRELVKPNLSSKQREMAQFHVKEEDN